MIVDIVFDREEYKAQGGKKLGTRPLNLYDHESIADTGADVCCTSPDVAMKMGLKLSETFQSSLQLFAADGRKLSVKGCIPVIINIGTWDKYKSVKEILYFVDGFKNTVLSREALKELGSVSKTFPEIASISLVTSKKLGDNVTNKFNPTKKYSDVVKQNLKNVDKARDVNQKKRDKTHEVDQKEGDKAHVVNDKDPDLLHLQKVASATKKPIIPIVLEEGDINGTVDVVTVQTNAPQTVGAAGNTCSGPATYWRPWN